uniref:PTS glucitol/sorbitol transporter subunit IIB n=1 Tax=Ndongobacter massiliensis TaxID=1871025 RepID=UPI00093081D3|nr:PTS glucitol/sorbitol transporter subunit IIB [Ndongobacter massiliensis]
MTNYRSVKISKGEGGWGGPLVILPTAQKKYIASVTGGGVDPVAEKIAEMTGAEAVDAFTKGYPDEEIICAVVDCGGTARCGVYPKKGILTVNLTAVGQSGPLAQYITPELYVSGVKMNNIQYTDEAASVPGPVKVETGAEEVEEAHVSMGKQSIITRIGKGVGGVVSKIFQAARDSVDMVLKNVLPFMVFISVIVGIINYTNIGTAIAQVITPLAGSVVGMVVLSFVCALPFISPLIGPGAVIAQIIGVLVGTQIAEGNIAPQMALPALFAIDAQVGGDFIPVGLSLGEAKPETVEIGVPAVLFSRMITGPIAVLIAWVASVGLFS